MRLHHHRFRRGAPRISPLAQRAGTVLREWDVDSEAGISELMVMIGRSLDSAADYSRSDRLWPGDPAQFGEAPVGLAHGAAGIIHALRSCRLDVNPLALSWFRDATDAELRAADPSLGLFDGLSGAAWVHARNGDLGRADGIIDLLRSVDLDGLGSDLYGGLPGIGLLYLTELERRPELLDDAVHLARTLHDRSSARAHEASSGAAGLMWGGAGRALFALRLFEHTGDRQHLSMASSAVEEDLRRCVTAADGSLQVDDKRRLMPYLASGSAGIGIVLAQLIPHLDDSTQQRQALSAITRAACAPFTVQAGLFEGRAGIVLFHITLARAGLSTPDARAALDDHVRALHIHAMRHGIGIGMAGDGLLRLSCDLATGAAGTLLALHSYSEWTHFPETRAGFDLPLLAVSAPQTAPTSAAMRSDGRR